MRWNGLQDALDRFRDIFRSSAIRVFYAANTI